MQAKAFDDNGRFVIVFEEITEEEKKALIEAYRPQVIDPVDAEPAQEADEKPYIENGVITRGRFAGMKPWDTLKDHRDSAFRELSAEIADLTGDDRKQLAALLNRYIRERFCGLDGKEYEARLTDKQCLSFLHIFDAVIPDSLWAQTPFGPERDLRNGSRDDVRALVRAVVDRYAKAAEKNR